MDIETKIIYHIDDEDTPYLVKVGVPPDVVTLGDLKNVLNKPGYKYFFKSMDDDFGIVKEEITDDAARLPFFNGRVISWLVTADGSDVGSNASDAVSQKGSDGLPFRPGEGRLGPGAGDAETETESTMSSRRGGRHPHQPKPNAVSRHEFGPRLNGHGPQVGKTGALGARHHHHLYQETTNSSMMSSDLETTSYWDSEDDLTCSRFSATTETTSRSRGSRFKKRRRKHRLPPPMERASSFSSITDSTLSLNIITVTLNMDTVNFLGISIVGQSNKGGDGGIYVGSIMKGGAVAQDGRIEPGDMILQVNEVSLENMSNDEAVGVLRDAVQKPGPIKLVVAKCWDPSPRGYFTVPRQEPVRPIDPSAWVAHTEAVRLQQHFDYGSLGPVPPGAPIGNLAGGSMMGVPLGVGPGSTVGGAMPMPRMGPAAGCLAPPGVYPPRPGPLSPSLTDLTSTSSSFHSAPETERVYEDLNLTVGTDMTIVAKAMAMPDSGLEIRDRMWLKIAIPNAFIGADLVDWLYNHVTGFGDRRDARKYAAQMLKQGLVRHTVNKSSFSEQCYYAMAPHVLELCGNLSSLHLEDNLDSVSEREANCGGAPSNAHRPVGVHPVISGPGGTTLPVAAYYQGPPYMLGGAGGIPYQPPPMGYTPLPYALGPPVFEGGGGEAAGSQVSVASRNSASTNSVDSVCLAVNGRRESKTEAGDGARFPQKLTPTAPTRDFLDDAAGATTTQPHAQHYHVPFDAATPSPGGGSGVTPTDYHQAPLHAIHALKANVPPAPRPPTGGGVGESASSPSSPSPPPSVPGSSASGQCRFAPQPPLPPLPPQKSGGVISPSGAAGPPSYNDVVASTSA